MKQKAETYKKKRIVMGDENLVTNSEIHIKDVVKDLYGDVPSGGGGTSRMEYWSFPNGLANDYTTEAIARFATLARYTAYNQTLITPPSYASTMDVEYNSFVGMAFNIDLKIVFFTGEVVTLGEMITELGSNLAAMGGVQITEEEFYTI